MSGGDRRPADSWRLVAQRPPLEPIRDQMNPISELNHSFPVANGGWIYPCRGCGMEYVEFRQTPCPKPWSDETPERTNQLLAEIRDLLRLLVAKGGAS